MPPPKLQSTRATARQQPLYTYSFYGREAERQPLGCALLVFFVSRCLFPSFLRVLDDTHTSSQLTHPHLVHSQLDSVPSFAHEYEDERGWQLTFNTRFVFIHLSSCPCLGLAHFHFYARRRSVIFSKAPRGRCGSCAARATTPCSSPTKPPC